MSDSRHVCPFCAAERGFSGKKNLSVNTGKGVWFCHRCSKGGPLDKLPLSVAETVDAEETVEVKEWAAQALENPLGFL